MSVEAPATKSLPLARLGYEVTIVDPSLAMLAKATDALCREDAATRRRVRLVEASAEQAPEVLTGSRFAAVLRHGALAAFEARWEIGILGLATRADTLEELTVLLAEHRQAWYSVWLFTDGWIRRG